MAPSAFSATGQGLVRQVALPLPCRGAGVCANHDPTDPAAVDAATRIATVTLEACRDLPDERAVVYSDLVLASLSKAVYEALMTLPARYEFQSEFARKHRAEGRAEGRAAVLKRLLCRRFGDLPGWAEGRIDAASAEQMDAWADALLTASSLGELLGPEQQPARSPDDSPGRP